MNNNLYSNILQERINAIKELNSNDETIFLKSVHAVWKEYWFGSPNAWIAFIGASPGNSPGGEYEKMQLPSFLKACDHFNYDDKRGFWKTIKEYSEFIVDDIAIQENINPFQLIISGNLVKKHAGDSRTISLKPEDEEVKKSIELLKRVQPKVVFTLQKEVQEIIKEILLSQKFTQSGVSEVYEIPSGKSKPEHYKVTNIKLESPDKSWRFILSKTPMHPSRKQLCDENNTKAFLKKVFVSSLTMN